MEQKYSKIKTDNSSQFAKSARALATASIFALGAAGAGTGCNHQIIDMNYKFDTAIVVNDGVATVIPIKTWGDYEGEQIQLKLEDGTTIVTSSFDTKLVRVNEKDGISADDLARAFVGEKGEVVNLSKLKNKKPSLDLDKDK